MLDSRDCKFVSSSRETILPISPLSAEWSIVPAESTIRIDLMDSGTFAVERMFGISSILPATIVLAMLLFRVSASIRLLCSITLLIICFWSWKLTKAATRIMATTIEVIRPRIFNFSEFINRLLSQVRVGMTLLYVASIFKRFGESIYYKYLINPKLQCSLDLKYIYDNFSCKSVQDDEVNSSLT